MLNEEILHFFKKRAGYVPGKEISRCLKISRAAIWKHIHELKDLGYDITSVPHLGYKLTSLADRLFPWEIKYHLKNKLIGKVIHYYQALGSTMEEAEQLALSGAAEGTLIIAEGQTKGRGRMGRTWISPKYQGIYFSLILRPQLLPGSTPILTLLAAVSICEAIGQACELEARIKWPNDILIQDRKLGGILTELSAEIDLTHFVVLGVGLNVNNNTKTLVNGATSLKQEKKEAVNRIILLQEILHALEKNYLLIEKKSNSKIIDKWRVFSTTLGKRIKVISSKRHLEGEAIDIDIDGGLLLRRDSGLIEKIMAGDVVYCR